MYGVHVKRQTHTAVQFPMHCAVWLEAAVKTTAMVFPQSAGLAVVGSLFR